MEQRFFMEVHQNFASTLDYDFAEEKKFSYKNLSMEEIIHHLAFFCIKIMADTCIRRGKHTNYGSIFY